jgi:hypothetical protein
MELRELLEVADRALADAGHAELTPDGRVGLAWPAVLALGSAALASAGYRPGKERHHERVVDSLQFTVELAQSDVGALHRIRRLRNQMTYERVGTTTAAEAQRFVERVRDLRETVQRWLESRHTDLK